MIDKFPLSPDTVWYDALVERYGDAVPPLERMRIRRGLQQHVGDMYAMLHDRDLLRHVEIISIETRTAAYVVIDTVDRTGAFDDDSIALNCAIELALMALAAACEHCGKPGEIVLKIGVEAQLADPDAHMGDRFLCMPCADEFQTGGQE